MATTMSYTHQAIAPRPVHPESLKPVFSGAKR